VVPDDVFRDQPVLTGRRVRLVPLTPAFLEDYWEFLQEPEGRRLTGTHATSTREQVVAYLESRPRQLDRADWAAVRISDGAFLGEAVINGLDPDNESAGYRIALAGPHVFGQGPGTEITQLVVDVPHGRGLDVVGGGGRVLHGGPSGGGVGDGACWQ
jgi:RimJ/RimL family protein N-acetyltransferase